MSYYSAAVISLLRGPVVIGDRLRQTQAGTGRQRVTQAGSNRRITQGGTPSGVQVSASGFSPGAGFAAGVGASTVVPPPPGLVAHWQFDETSGSTVSNLMSPRNGTVIGGGLFEPARINNGLRLSGAGQYVDFLADAGLVSSGFTYALWVNFDTNAIVGALISKIQASGSFLGFLLEQSGTAMLVYLDGSTQKIGAANFITLADVGQWTHVAVVLDTAGGSTARLYKNGVQFATGAYISVTDPGIGVPFYVGRQNGFSNRDFDGVVDDLRVYNYPLSATDVAALYSAGGSGSGNVGPIEAVNGSAVQVAISTGSTARQAFDRLGWGAGGPSDVPAITSILTANATNRTRLFSDLNTKVMRLIMPSIGNAPDAGGFVSIHLDLVNMAIANGVDRFTCLGFYKQNGYTPTQFADAVHAAINGGIPITHCCLQNEPDGSGVFVDPAECVAVVQECRARLNALGRASVKLVGMEWAKFSQSNLSEFDAYKDAGLFPNTVAMPAGHCYKGCPTYLDYDDRAATVAGVPGLWSGETGNGFMPGQGAKLVCGLNFGLVVDVHHGGQNPYAPASPQYANASIQCLVDPDGTTMPWWSQRKLFMEILLNGTIFRRCSSNDVPPTQVINGNTVTISSDVATNMLRSFSPANPRLNVCVGKRPDGRWIILAVNTTNGTGDSSGFATVCYPAATIQPTVTIPELSGTKAVWSARRCSVAGAITDGADLNMQAGVIRFTLAAGESIALKSP